MVRLLPRDALEREVEEAFSKYGKVIFTKMCSGERSNFAFIQFAETHECEDAKEALNATELLGCQVQVTHANTPDEQRAYEDEKRRYSSPPLRGRGGFDGGHSPQRHRRRSPSVYRAKRDSN